MTRFFTPLFSGTDDFANELAHEFTEDPDAMPLASLLPTTPPPTLATLADIARTAFGTVDESPTAAHGSLPLGDKAALLKWRG